MSDASKKPLCLGLAGFGTVGSGLARIVEQNKDHIKARTGREIIIRGILVRDKSRERQAPIPESAILTDNMDELINIPEIDVIVEVMGGIDAAGDLIEKALNAGKHVVTANKALLAETGNKFFALAEEKNLHLCYEASVCGGIPIIETLKQGLAANKLTSLMGILNGTSNFILSEMSTKGLSFEDALKDAQDKGYAEADPTLDIEGMDAAHKLSLLIRLGWGVEYPFSQMKVTGITGVKPIDIDFARTFGYRIKLIAHAKTHADGIEAAVFPALVHETYLLSRVGGAYNAVRIHGDAVGSVFLHGQGAGDMPTGSAVAADILNIATGNRPNNTGFAELPKTANLVSEDKITSPFYIRLRLTDKPGVLRDIAGIMAENNISIAQAIQKRVNGNGTPQDDDQAILTIMTHLARVKDVEKTLEEIADTGMVHEEPTHYRVLSREAMK